jgi:hypothetical protein
VPIIISRHRPPISFYLRYLDPQGPCRLHCISQRYSNESAADYCPGRFNKFLTSPLPNCTCSLLRRSLIPDFLPPTFNHPHPHTIVPLFLLNHQYPISPHYRLSQPISTLCFMTSAIVRLPPSFPYRDNCDLPTPAHRDSTLTQSVPLTAPSISQSHHAFTVQRINTATSPPQNRPQSALPLSR